MGFNLGSFAGGAAKGYSQGIKDKSDKDDAEWKKKERERLESDRAVDDDINKQTAEYMKVKLAPKAEEVEVPIEKVAKNPMAGGLAEAQPIAAGAEVLDAPVGPVGSIASRGIGGMEAAPVEAKAAQPKYRKPDVNDMVDVAQHRSSLYMNAGKYDKALGAHKDFIAFSAEKLKGEEKQRGELARTTTAGIMMGDYSGLGRFYEAFPDGRKLGNVATNEDGTIAVTTIGKDGIESAPVTFKNNEHLANAVMSMTDSNVALKYMDNNGKRAIEEAKVNNTADHYRATDEHYRRSDAESRRHNTASEDIWRKKVSTVGGITLPQQRTNFEIESARKQIAGMSQQEIKKRTQQYSATGRENPDYDGTLAAKVRQASRRKYGEDEDFESISTPTMDNDQPDISAKFSLDQGMKGHRLGKKTPSGFEVLDANGRLIGHYN